MLVTKSKSDIRLKVTFLSNIRNYYLTLIKTVLSEVHGRIWKFGTKIISILNNVIKMCILTDAQRRSLNQ